MAKRVFILLMIVSLTAFISSCGKEVGEAGIIKGDSYQTEGWIDDNTFQVSAIGTWPEDKADAKKVIKMNLAEEGAVLKAQTRIMEKFKGYALKAKGGAESGASLGEVAVKTIEGYAKGGSVIKKTFDDELNCEVLYRVEAKGLKKMAEAGFE